MCVILFLTDQIKGTIVVEEPWLRWCWDIPTASRPNVLSTALFGDHKTRGSDWLCSVTLLILKTHENIEKTKLHQVWTESWEALICSWMCCQKKKTITLYNQSGSDCRCTYCWSQHQLLSKAITCRLKRTAWKTGNLIVETTKAHIIQTNAGCVPSLYQGGLNINDVLECLSKAQHTHFILG